MPVQERLGDVVGGDHRAQRRVGRGDALRRRDHVRLVVEAFAAEPVPEPAPRADHLVGDQQHPVAVADLAHALEVAVLGHEAAAAVLHRLEDHRRDRLRALEQDRLLDRVRRPQRVAILAPAVGVRVRHVMPAGRERLERRAQRAAGRSPSAPPSRCRGRRACARSACAGSARPRGVVGLRELPRRLDRLRAAGGEEHAVEVPRRELGDARGQLDRARVRVAPVRVEAELLAPACAAACPSSARPWPMFTQYSAESPSR